MLTVPNLITFLRLLLVPVVVYFLIQRNYGPAFLVFAAAALGDLLDGVLARALNQFSRLGALLDPIADKLTMLSATLLLAWHGLLPLWLAAAIVGRDAVIVGGAIAYHFVVGQLDMAPTWLSKLNTFLEFGLLSAVLAHAAQIVALDPWLPGLFALVLATVTASGLQYVWIWGRKAARQTHRHG